ncbi:MauE/DoxX family redox-associated membrane protein [Nocardiopsis sp. NPDC057823]|uniref:MauE/DoxX family redox-associated membrane protein n=1 Tax=Nocardiopsis sp. NPDC057823 TaxID=3346256 RepID=UPI00366EE2FC
MFSLLVAARTLLAVVLAASVLGKLRGRSARRDFVSAVERLAPARAVRALTPPGGPRRAGARAAAAGVLAAEAATVALLVSAPAAGLLCALVLLSAFTAALVGALRRGDRAPCACFGAAGHPIRPAHVVRNLLLAGAGAAGLAAAALDPQPAGAAAAAVAAAAGAAAALPFLLLDDLLDLFTPLRPGNRTSP